MLNDQNRTQQTLWKYVSLINRNRDIQSNQKLNSNISFYSTAERPVIPNDSVSNSEELLYIESVQWMLIQL